MDPKIKFSFRLQEVSSMVLPEQNMSYFSLAKPKSIYVYMYVVLTLRVCNRHTCTLKCRSLRRACVLFNQAHETTVAQKIATANSYTTSGFIIHANNNRTINYIPVCLTSRHHDVYMYIHDSMSTYTYMYSSVSWNVYAHIRVLKCE